MRVLCPSLASCHFSFFSCPSDPTSRHLRDAASTVSSLGTVSFHFLPFCRYKLEFVFYVPASSATSPKLQNSRNPGATPLLRQSNTAVRFHMYPASTQPGPPFYSHTLSFVSSLARSVPLLFHIRKLMSFTFLFSLRLACHWRHSGAVALVARCQSLPSELDGERSSQHRVVVVVVRNASGIVTKWRYKVLSSSAPPNIAALVTVPGRVTIEDDSTWMTRTMTLNPTSPFAVPPPVTRCHSFSQLILLCLLLLFNLFSMLPWTHMKIRRNTSFLPIPLQPVCNPAIRPQPFYPYFKN